MIDMETKIPFQYKFIILRRKTMTIQSPSGKYTTTYDPARKVVIEQPVGAWTLEDFNAYNEEFSSKIISTIKMQPWSLLCDMSKYVISDLGNSISERVDWLASVNVQYAAMVVDSAAVKMQMNRASGNKIPTQAFTSREEANDWLKSKGF
jgi:hypothetical protein